MPRNSACQRCILHAGTKHVCLWGVGDGRRGGVMLLGEAPGGDEEIQGRPFVGMAGRELDSILAKAGHNRTEVYVTNAVKCRPPANRTPNQGELNACFPYLAEEIEANAPAVILCLGGAAMKALTGKDAVGSNRGQLLPSRNGVRVGEAKILVTYHPASMLHNRSVLEQARIREAMVSDFKLAFRLANPNDSEGPKDHKVALLTPGYSAASLVGALKVLESARILAADLEWAALDGRDMSWPWTKGASLFSIALSGRIDDKIVSLSFSWPPPDDGMVALKDFFSRKPVVFHNALADLNWMASVGLPVVLGGDTLILSYLMNENEGHKLEQLAVAYAGVEPGWKIPPRATAPSSHDGWIELLTYNSLDTYATLKLAEALHARLEALGERERDGIKRMYYNLMLPVVPTMVSIALTGIPMRAPDVKEEIDLSLARTEAIKGQVAGITGMSNRQAAAMAGSPQKTMEYLRQAYGLEIDSSNRDELTGYESYPVIPAIQQYRWERNKVQGTYLGPWYQLLTEQDDGRLHSVYRLTYARTGRTSAEIEIGGSLQLMPREQKGRDLKVRHLVKARPGYVIVSADYSQIEIRMMAWFANERVMLELYRNDEDLHKATAAFIKNQPLKLDTFWPNRASYMEAVSKEDRQGAKGVNFGLLFGQEVPGLIDYCRKTYGVSMTYEQGELAHSSFFKLYPDVRTYHEHCERVIFPRGYTETPLGRFRRNLEDARKAINTPIQATASDLALYAMAHIDRRFKTERWPAFLIGFVHDSILAEVKAEYVNRAIDVIREEMEHPDLRPFGISSIPVPLKADIVQGLSWGEAE